MHLSDLTAIRIFTVTALNLDCLYVYPCICCSFVYYMGGHSFAIEVPSASLGVILV